MVKKPYNNQLSKPQIEEHKKALRERAKLDKEKLMQGDAESDSRAIRTFYGGTNHGD